MEGNKRRNEPESAGCKNVNYKRKIIYLVESLDEDKERRFLIQIYTMIRRHILRETH